MVSKQKKVRHQHKKQITSSGSSNQRWGLFLFFALAVTFLVFSNSINNDFITNWDDKGYIHDNPYIKTLSFESVKAIFTSFYNGNYHPLTTISYAIEYKLFQLNPKPYHISNLAFHLLNVALVFWFVRLISSRIEIAFITALFFGIHPMHVESVSWISERKDVMYGLFYLGASISYLYYLLSEKKKIQYYFITLLLFLCSLLSKSAAVSLPVLLLLFDFYVHGSISKKSLLEKIPFFGLSILFGILAIYSQSAMGAIQDITPAFSFFDRLFLASYASSYYLVKLFVPLNLSALHPYPLKSDGLLPILYYLSPLLIILITWGVFKMKNFKKELVFGLLYFLISIALVLQILPVGKAIVADRYSYIPYIGLFFIMGKFSVFAIEKFKKWKMPVVVFLSVFALLFCYLTYQRNKIWKDGLILFTDVIKQYPYVDYAYNNRGLVKADRKDYHGAIADYTEAARINPRFAEAINNRGFSKYFLNDYAAAIADFTEAIRVDSSYQLAYFNRGILKGEINDFHGAVADYGRAIKIKPDYADAYYNRGNVKINHLKDYKGAIEDYTATVRIKPGFPDAFHNRGVAKYLAQDFQGAIEDFNTAIQIRPSYAEAYNNRGSARFYMKQMNEACNDWRQASQLGHPSSAQFISQYCK